MDNEDYLIVAMLQGFIWLDDGLQSYLRSKGWPEVTRSQSMVMTNVAIGVRRPSDIARNLGVSRQAIHVTIRQMVALGILELVDDPGDGRSKMVAISAVGQRMGENAEDATQLMIAALRRRIGAERVDHLKKALAADWGPPMRWDGKDA